MLCSTWEDLFHVTYGMSLPGHCFTFVTKYFVNILISKGRREEELGILQFRAQPIWSNPYTSLQQERSTVAVLSQTLYIHPNLLPVSSFPVFSDWTDHSVVLEDSHTLMELFYFSLRSASHATKAREEEQALCTVSATYFWLLFPLHGFGFIQGLFSLGIIGDLHACTQVKLQSESTCVPISSPVDYSWWLILKLP